MEIDRRNVIVERSSDNKRRHMIRLSHHLKKYELTQNQIKPIGRKTLLKPNQVTIQLEQT